MYCDEPLSSFQTPFITLKFVCVCVHEQVFFYIYIPGCKLRETRATLPLFLGLFRLNSYWRQLPPINTQRTAWKNSQHAYTLQSNSLPPLSV